MKWIRNNLLTFLMVTGLIVGIVLLVYPSVANYWNSFHQTQVLIEYNDVVSSMSKEDYKKFLDDAKEYNNKLAESGIIWNMSDSELEEYEKKLNINKNGIMGYISIPKVHIKLPIYHGTSESVLQVAIGHIEGSSLPVGGKGTHCIVSGHRGLPSAKLFTDVDKIKEGDTWTMTVLNETITYECDQIRIVEPEDLSELQIVEGEDLCTLVTCTPYGVNTHRLLIRGHRVANADGTADITADAIQIEPVYIAPVLAVPALIILFLILLIASIRARRGGPGEIMKMYLERKGLSK